MNRFFIHLCAGAFASLFILLSAAGAKETRCDTLELCEAEVRLALNARDSREYYVSNYDISEAFASFDQAGFDALFEMMEGTVGDDQDVLIASLSHMTMDASRSFVFEISQGQYETLTRMWSQQPNYFVGKLINFADTPASHAFMIKALLSPDKEAQDWAKNIIEIADFGNGTSPIAEVHLLDILDLIRRDNYAVLVPTLKRIDSPQAIKALWSLLNARDEWVFAEAFKSLQEQNEAGLYQALKAQSFLNTPAGHQRALMIAETIRRSRNGSNPTEKAYHFWTTWYDSAKSDVERIIPAYQLFYLFEATKKEVKGSGKFIEDRERWRSYTQANPEGRTGSLSVEALNRAIKNKRAETARLTPFLQIQTARLTRDENQTFEDYFRIFDAHRLSQKELSYEYGRGDYLPLSFILDAAIQTPKIWADRFWPYVEERPFAENLAIVERITALDTDEKKLKSLYLKRLSYLDNSPKLFGTLRLIAQTDALRNDRDIRDAVKAASQGSPFTRLKMAVDYVLSESKPDQNTWPFDLILWGSPFEEAMKNENAKRAYCNPASRAEADYMRVTPELNLPRLETYNQLGKPVMTIKTPSGYLSGHDRGEFGGGLVYYSSIADKGQLLQLRYARNIIAIAQSEQEGVYWALAGLNHLMPGMGAIYKIDARTDRVSAAPHKRLPSVPRATSFLKGGDLFMDFRQSSYTSYDMENGGGTTVHKLEDEKYNPPVILTRNGELVNACGD